jgi:Leucine-rich repeat (LRR) protein
MMRGTTYTCALTISNPNGRDDFTEITGTHLTNRTNADVEYIDAFGQNSRNVPQIFCQQFPNTRTIYMSASGVAEVTENSFSGCAQLNTVALVFNSLTSLPNGLFGSNPQLEFAYLGYNQISSVGIEAFTGSGATYIDLEFNDLRSYNAEIFVPVNQTLQVKYSII